MSELLKAILSISSLKNYAKSDFEMESLLKRFAIFYDEIILDVSSRRLKDHFINSTYANPWFHSSVDTDFLLDLQRRSDFPFSRLEDYSDLKENIDHRFITVSEQSLFKTLHSYATNRFRYLHPRNEDDYSWYESHYSDICSLRNELLYDFVSNTETSEYFSKSAVNISPTLAKAARLSPSESATPSQLFTTDLLVPNFNELYSWDDLIDLRNDNSIKLFRQKLYSIRNSNDLDKTLFDEMQKDLWSLVDLMKPKTGAEIAFAVAANAPSPIIVNPIGIGKFFLDIQKEKNLLNEKGYLIFLQKVRPNS